MDEEKYIEQMKNAQPAWVKDGFGVRGKAESETIRGYQPPKQDAYTGKVVRQEIPPS